MPSPVILWLRHDLRLADNLALLAAAELKVPIIPVFIWSPEEEKPFPPGAASRWWLHHSLASLGESLAKLGAPLVLMRGPALQALASLQKQSGADAVFWNHSPEPAWRDRDARLAQALSGLGLTVENFDPASLLHDPDRSLNGQGKPYQVFTPFYKAWFLGQNQPLPHPAPKKLTGYFGNLPGLGLEELRLLPSLPWAARFAEVWKPGEKGALKRAQDFVKQGLDVYAEDRDFPARAGISGLSPHLHFGEISPRTLWHLAQAHGDEKRDERGKEPRAETWLRQLAWREFAHHLLRHFPHTPHEPLRPAFAKFPWRKDDKALKAWQKGKTGYPLVDAGMRELWATGFMHNRVRMVVGSFLVKHLLLPWQAGAAWFWDTLVDADLANNTLGWQWIAGCGADAAPYFRIFNPVTQSEKFDAEGAYIRRWVPELRALPAPWIHQPFAAPPLELAAAGVELGVTYPHSLVDHGFARNRALAAYHEREKG